MRDSSTTCRRRVRGTGTLADQEVLELAVSDCIPPCRAEGVCPIFRPPTTTPFMVEATRCQPETPTPTPIKMPTPTGRSARTSPTNSLIAPKSPTRSLSTTISRIQKATIPIPKSTPTKTPTIRSTTITTPLDQTQELFQATFKFQIAVKCPHDQEPRVPCHNISQWDVFVPSRGAAVWPRSWDGTLITKRPAGP